MRIFVRVTMRECEYNTCVFIVHCNSTIIYFYQREQNLTQFIKVLLVKLSDMLHSSNFVRLFHRQSFAKCYTVLHACFFSITYNAPLAMAMVNLQINPV